MQVFIRALLGKNFTGWEAMEVFTGGVQGGDSIFGVSCFRCAYCLLITSVLKDFTACLDVNMGDTGAPGTFISLLPCQCCTEDIQVHYVIVHCRLLLHSWPASNNSALEPTFYVGTCSPPFPRHVHSQCSGNPLGSDGRPADHIARDGEVYLRGACPALLTSQLPQI